MSSKDEKRKRPLVPRLRFPEFREAGEWERKLMGELYSFKGNNSFSRDNLNYDHGAVKNIHYGDIHTKFSALFDIRKERVPFINSKESIKKIDLENYCLESDMIFADASEDLADVGKSIELINLNGERVLSGLHTILARQKNSNLIVGFGGYLFQSKSIRNQIRRESQGTKVFSLSSTRLAKIQVFFPARKEEQQKIADCLSSLDERITLEAQKLEALKRHKKGLMQQLFPREGETLPRLRFLEFREAGEWNSRTIGETCETFSGGTPSTSNKKFYGGTIPFIRSAEIGESKTALFLTEEGLSSSSAKIVRKDDVLIALYGANSGEVSLCKLNGAINQAILCIRHENNNAFLYQHLTHKKHWIISAYIQGGQGNLSGEIVKSLRFNYPDPNEQQKIADCLSSLDKVISLEAQKLEALKRHKKGLMQQLFPVLDDGDR